MFEHFTFGVRPPPCCSKNHDDDDVSLSTSPTDTSLPITPRPPVSYFPAQMQIEGICDIVTAFSQQSLYPSDDDAIQTRWTTAEYSPTFSIDAVSEEDDEEAACEELAYRSTRRGVATTRPATTTLTSSSSRPRAGRACRRLQRQLNVQLQSCSAHVRDISALVEAVIAQNGQCRLVSPARRAREEREEEEEEDEGFHEIEMDRRSESRTLEEEAATAMTLRRARTPNGVRKAGGGGGRWQARGRSECVTLQVKRSLPRLRRRKRVE